MFNFILTKKSITIAKEFFFFIINKTTYRQSYMSNILNFETINAQHYEYHSKVKDH